ncbi:hypothetical protein GOV13_03055, partial [Candidatus Pacearchaeota archaeon]|nr:hypothetical protein [Candidatus Pacearchaeota archaeon]
MRWNSRLNPLFGILVVFIILSSSGSTLAVSKADYVQHVETKADITSAYTIYRVCNPTAANMVLDSDSDFSVAFLEDKNRLASWDIKVEEVEDYIEEVPIYDYVNVTVNEIVYDNATGVNTTVQKIKKEKVQIGVNQIPKTRKIWKTFQPKGKTFGV